MFWKNDLISIAVNAEIVEYDIKHGNTSIMEAFQMVDQELIDHLNSLTKKKRVEAVGVMQGKNPDFAKALEDNFDIAVNEFLEANGLDRETDVVEIARDAVFVLNKPVKQTVFRSSIHFVKKNVYHAMLRLDTGLLFYFDREKGIRILNFMKDSPKKDETIRKLTPGMLSFLNELIEVCEASNMGRVKIYQYLKNFIKLYRGKELDMEYYREFKPDPKFKVIFGDSPMVIDGADEYYYDDLDISYNYLNIIIPVLKVVI